MRAVQRGKISGYHQISLNYSTTCVNISMSADHLGNTYSSMLAFLLLILQQVSLSKNGRIYGHTKNQIHKHVDLFLQVCWSTNMSHVGFA